MTEEDKKWINLLTKPFKHYTPEEYKAYVRLLLDRPVRKEKVIKIKPPFVCGLTPKGKLSLSVKRKGKYLTPDELVEIGKRTGRPANEVFLKVRRMKIAVMTHEEASSVEKTLDEMPF